MSRTTRIKVFMLLLRPPDSSVIDKFIGRQSGQHFSYPAVGSSATSPPHGYVVDRTRGLLGHGRQAFGQAKAAIRRWDPFQLGWVEPGRIDTPIESDRVVAVVTHLCGVHFLYACRIVYVVDESRSDEVRFGFAYGTLNDHAESGEERFMVSWNRSDDTVWYEILAFSRPNRWYTKLGYPLVRRIQRRFANDSLATMKRVAAY